MLSTQHFRRYCHVSQRYVNDFGLACRWQIQESPPVGMFWVVVTGAELRHCLRYGSIGVHPVASTLRISLRIHHNGKSTNPIDQPELSWITKPMLLPVVWSYRHDDQSLSCLPGLHIPATRWWKCVRRNHPGPLTIHVPYTVY